MFRFLFVLYLVCKDNKNIESVGEAMLYFFLFAFYFFLFAFYFFLFAFASNLYVNVSLA